MISQEMSENEEDLPLVGQAQSKHGQSNVRRTMRKKVITRRHRRTLVALCMKRGLTTNKGICEFVEKQTGHRPSTATVQRDMEALWKQWRINYNRSYSAYMRKQIAELEEVKFEAWRAYLRSIGDHKTVTLRTEDMFDKDGNPILDPNGKSVIKKAITEVTDPKAGDPRHLAMVEKCIMDEAKLTGTLIERKQTVDDQGTVIGSTQWMVELMKYAERANLEQVAIPQRALEGTDESSETNVVDGDFIKHVADGDDSNGEDPHGGGASS